MTTVTQIINDAYRQSNLIAVEASPTANQTTEALRHLNRLVKSVFGKEVGENLQSMPIGKANIVKPSGFPWYNPIPEGDWVLPENLRLILNLESPVTIHLHPEPHDGARIGIVDAQNNLATNTLTLVGNGRLIQGATSVVVNTSGSNIEWFYRGDLANWLKYAPLAAIDTFPLPEEFDTFFITMLAVSLNPSYGVELNQQSLLMMKRAENQLKARYRQSKEKQSERGLYHMPLTTADRGLWGRELYDRDPSDLFNTGYPYY